jgi:hypothetical protein
MTASTAKKNTVTSEENSVAATRKFVGNELTKPEKPICAPRKAASALA